jgi:hypothetical protein
MNAIIMNCSQEAGVFENLRGFLQRNTKEYPDHIRPMPYSIANT